jgi:uncharacterized damage-inducible protein DinB
MATTSAPSKERISQSPSTLLFHDLKQEMDTTRRVLERVPDGKEDWRPHEKSMTLGALSTHVAELPGYGIAILTTDEFDGAGGIPGTRPTNTGERLKRFEEQSSEFRRLVGSLTWDAAVETWRFKFGDRVVVEGERAKLLRPMVLTHIAHHRAQLGVYLRLLGVPVPGTYGPSADEPMPMR